MVIGKETLARHSMGLLILGVAVNKTLSAVDASGEAAIRFWPWKTVVGCFEDCIQRGKMRDPQSYIERAGDCSRVVSASKSR